MTREFSQDPPPANYEYLTPTMVNEENCDLLNRKSRTVDLAFQRVQEPIVQEISSFAILADRLFKENSERENCKSAGTFNARDK